jgi:hypothetical protein
MGVVRVFIIFFLLTTPTFAQDPPRISLDTFRGLRIGHAPLTMIIKIKVPRHETNRLVCITWASSEAMAGESCYEYDGESMIMRNYELRDLSAGEYAARATLYAAEKNAKGERVVKEYYSNTLTFRALGVSEEP